MAVELDTQFFEQICRSLNFAVIAADADGAVRFWNAAAARMFEGRPDLAHGRPIAGIFPESARPRLAQFVQQALRDGKPADLEYTRDRDEDQGELLTAVISPIIGEDGARRGVSICVRDITARRAVTRHLAKVRRMSSLGSMAGGVAHHFNSILGGVSTKLDFMLSMMNPRDRLYKDLQAITEAVGRAARISGQLMTFAEGNHDSGYPEDMATVLRTFVNEMTPELIELGIQLVAQIQNVTPTRVESRRLRAAMESLKQNAVEAMPEGGVLTVGLRESGELAVITIADSGSGIPQNKIDHIFDPFYTTKGELGGGAGRNTGLGLSVVHSFIADMGGTIDVQSRPGRGTTFEIRLPLGTEEMPARRDEGTES
jgi:PAS domain S-box-containing protein